MLRSRVVASLLCFCCAPACYDDPEMVMIKRQQALDARVQQLEAQVSALAERVKRLEAPTAAATPAEPTRMAVGATPAGPTTMTVEVTPVSLRVDRETVDLARLEALMRERRARAPGLALEVTTTPDIAHARIYEILDLAKRAGIEKVGLKGGQPGGAKP